MNISHTDRGTLTIIKLTGKFDIEQTEHFEASFAEIIARRPEIISLDMNELNFIDSSGMGALIKALNTVKNAGGEMILFGLKPMIMNVFKLAKLDSFFKVMTAEDFERKYGDDSD